jgi:hypothetical protein
MHSMSRTVEREPVYAFRLTPAEWRQVLADGTFLCDPDNSIRPRRLMGVPVEIIPDHRFIAPRLGARAR